MKRADLITSTMHGPCVACPCADWTSCSPHHRAVTDRFITSRPGSVADLQALATTTITLRQGEPLHVELT